MDDKKSCFIITPIGKENEPIRRHIEGIIDAAINPVFEEKYNISVAHRMSNVGSISKQIIEAIYVSDLVIANLTQINPNAMYELAIRHCIGSPVIIIAEEGTDLPFDVIDERTIFYKNDAQGVLELQKRLEQCLSTLKDFHTPDSLIYDVLKDKLKNEQILNIIETSTNTEDIDTMKYIVNKLEQIDSYIQNIMLVSNRNQQVHKTKNVYSGHLSFNIINKEQTGKDISQFLFESWSEFQREVAFALFLDQVNLRGLTRQGALIIVDIDSYIRLSVDETIVIGRELEAFLNRNGFDVDFLEPNF